MHNGYFSAYENVRDDKKLQWTQCQWQERGSGLLSFQLAVTNSKHCKKPFREASTNCWMRFRVNSCSVPEVFALRSNVCGHQYMILKPFPQMHKIFTVFKYLSLPLLLPIFAITQSRYPFTCYKVKTRK